MAEREPMTQTINVTEARQRWSELLNRVSRRETQLIVEKAGVPVAAIISVKDLERLRKWEERRRRRFEALHQSQAAFEDLPDEEVERELAKAIAEVRAESHPAAQR
jgi:prevent-host-death family protein